MNLLVKLCGLTALFLFLRVFAFTTEESYFYETLFDPNNFENSTTEEYNATSTGEEVPNDDHNPNTNALKIVNVKPKEIVVDTTTDLELSIANHTGNNSTLVFCFLSTPDNDVEVLSSNWISETRINCKGFNPLVSGLFFITTDFSSALMNDGDRITVKVISKHPVAERAEYSHNYDKILIHFDGNIELRSHCASTFSQKSLEYFGAGFGCSVISDVLVIKMGVDFKRTTTVEIRVGNKICRSGSGKEFCLSAKPGNVGVTEPKVLGPMLSLLTISDCTGNKPNKYWSIKLSSSNQKQSSDVDLSPDNLGKIQRKNLMMWKAFRRIQNKLSSNMTLKIDKSDIQSPYENLAAIENFIGKENMQSISSTPGVTVSVELSPSVGNILAEANVKFCRNFSQLFRYKWIVNNRAVHENDRLLTVRDATPGRYVIKCDIIAFNSTEVLGQGLTTTEVLDSRPKVIVYPVERVIEATEDVFLRAVVWHGGTISWTCRTNFDKVCITNSQELISDVINMNSFNVSIPAGILPPGEYIWTAEKGQGLTTARIIIKNESRVAINIEMASIFSGPYQKIILQGTVKKVENECRIWWSSVRQKGFNYINLQHDGDEDEVREVRGENIEQKMTLIIPRSLKNWKGFETDSLYMFKLQAFCPRSGSFEYIKVPISINSAPRVSSIEVEPIKGLAMATTFTISEVQADDSVEDYPLLFEWSYLDTCGVETPITRGASSRQITTFLPPGDIKVILRVCDAKRACSKVSSSVIDVSHSKIIPENFYDAANQIFYLMVSRDYLEAFGLATTVFKSLALKAETEIRQVVFRNVKEGIYVTIKQFNESLKENPNIIESCLDFVDRALTLAKYLPKGSGISRYLTEFRHSVLNYST